MFKELKKCLNSEKKDISIVDIVVFGSSVKGASKPHDLDIAVLFNKGSLKERLEKIQKIKRKIVSQYTIDIKGILLEELFQEQFFARSGILLEGISIFDEKPLCSKLGFTASTVFTYSLKNKTHTEKVKFNYVLSGRYTAGIVKLYNAKHLAPGVILVPIVFSHEFEQALKTHAINYKKNNILIEK